LVYYFAAGAIAKYCDEYVCVSVCVSVCPRVYLRNHNRDLYQIFWARCLWPWLGPHPTSLLYIAVPRAESVKYLGVIIYNRLKFDIYINHIVNTCTSC